MTSLLWVGTGGALGAVARHLAGLAAHRLPGGAVFPYGTLVVNLIGCLAIGVVAGLLEVRPDADPSVRLFLVTGVLGGFTTFSAFGLETVQLARGESPGLALLSVLLQVVLGVAAAWVGMTWARPG